MATTLATRLIEGVLADTLSCRRTDELAELITTSRTVMSSFAKAKTAKIGMSGIQCS